MRFLVYGPRGFFEEDVAEGSVTSLGFPVAFEDDTNFKQFISMQVVDFCFCAIDNVVFQVWMIGSSKLTMYKRTSAGMGM